MTVTQIRVALSQLPQMDRHSLADAGILVDRDEWEILHANPVRWALSLDDQRFALLCAVLTGLSANLTPKPNL